MTQNDGRPEWFWLAAWLVLIVTAWIGAHLMVAAGGRDRRRR